MTQETKHTPFKATLVECETGSQNHYVVTDGNDNFVAKTYGSGYANLIVSAPSLLKALKVLCDPDWARADPAGFAEQQEKYRVLIAKAEGK